MDMNNYSYTAPGFLDERPRTPIDPTLFDTRAAALDLAYKIPGYKAAQCKTKNFIYNQIVKAVSPYMIEPPKD